MNIAPILLGGALVAFWIYERAQPRGLVLPPSPVAPPAAPETQRGTIPTTQAPIPLPGEVWRITGTISPSPPEGFRDQMIAAYKRAQTAAGNRVLLGPLFHENGPTGFTVEMEAGPKATPIFIGRSIEIGPYTITITSAVRLIGRRAS